MGETASRPGWENWPLLADARQTGAVTTGRAPTSALEPTPVANPRIWALPPGANSSGTCHPALRARAGGGFGLRPAWVVRAVLGQANGGRRRVLSAPPPHLL